MARPKGLQEYPWQWGFDAGLLGHTPNNPYYTPANRAQWAEGYELGKKMRRKQTTDIAKEGK